MKYLGVFLLCFLMLLGCHQPELFDDHTDITIMVYMCGSDLESELGSATKDLNEMLAANFSEDVHVVIETGGSREWKNNVVSSETNQRYLIQHGELILVDPEVGLRDMADPNTLSDFISYAANEFPADRYALILWDHGGGALDGFAVDENFDKVPMKIYELEQALKNGGVFFDFIGFDACLMSTIEVGLVLKDYANFMIASEETEPAGGWYYTNWLTYLSQNPNMDTLDLGKLIVDDFISMSDVESHGMDATLAVIDLSKIEVVYDAVCDLLNEANLELQNHNFEVISKGRSNSKSFGDVSIDHVDLADLAKEINLEQSDVLIKAINDCVKYKGNANPSDDVGGLAIYFPYVGLKDFNQMRNVYKKIGFDEDYTSFMELFVRIMSDRGYIDYSWEIEDRGDYDVLILSDNNWDVISKVECQLYYDDGEGYLYLGSYEVDDFDEERNLVLTFDHTWIAINGHIVPFYELAPETKTDKWISYGYVPAYVNGQEAEIILAWDKENPDGKVAGYRYGYEESSILLRGLIPIEVDDVLEFVVDSYSYKGDYEGEYYLRDSILVDEAGLIVSRESITQGDYLVAYRMTDLYQNSYITEKILFKHE